MKRIKIEPRPHANKLVASQGLVYNLADLAPGEKEFWADDRYYSFEGAEIKLLEEAAKDVFDMCCEAVDYLLEHPDIMTEKMAVPAYCLKQIRESWDRDPPWGSVYGRFDVCFGGLDNPDPRLRLPKFYEFNADSPTSLVESNTIQWMWLVQTGHGNDQWNLIDEMLVQAWKRNLDLIEANIGHRPLVHFAVGGGDTTGEDTMNAWLLMQTCSKAGYKTKMMAMEQIGLAPDGRFYDEEMNHIDVIFKLYPWEYMVREQFGESAFKDMDTIGRRNDAGEYVGGTIWIEAPYRMLWSNKAIFAVLWKLFKDDPRSKWLLPTYFEDEKPESMTRYARKPIFSREGADIALMADGEELVRSPWSAGVYGAEGHVVQELALLPAFGAEDEGGVDYHPCLGIWMVDGESAGMGVREDLLHITTDEAFYVPHSISDAPLDYVREPVPDLSEIEANMNMDRCAHTVGEKSEVLKYIEEVVGFGT